MPNYLEIMTPGAMQSIASSTVTGSYATLGTLAHPARLVKIVNNSTQDITVSWNATTDHDYIPSASFSLYDCTGNAVSNSKYVIPNATVFSVKGTAGTGNVYLVYFYAQ